MEQDFPVKRAEQSLRIDSSINLQVSERTFQSLPWPVEQTDIVLLNESQLLEAEAFVDACEACADSAEISFDYLLDAITGCDPAITEYVMSHPAKCPRCGRDVTEKTLVIPA